MSSNKPTPKIIPSDLKGKLRKAAKREATSLWEIGDLAREVFEYVHKERANKRLKEVYDFQVWAAIGEACSKSGGRVKKLAAISKAYPKGFREEYVDRWEFGYFERAFDMGPPIIDKETGEVVRNERIKAIEFLDEYANGEMSEGIPRQPTIGNFIPIYRQHILGLESEGGVDVAVFSPEISAIIPPIEPTPIEELKDALNQAHNYIEARIDTPVSKEIVELISRLESLLPLLRNPAVEEAFVGDQAVIPAVGPG